MKSTLSSDEAARPKNAPWPGVETDLAELAAKFSAHSGGKVSPKVSADLALEIVLNEIVEQACLATAATGAAIALESDGEMVCRASSGTTAPALGARLDGDLGLSGECIRTHQLQRCDNAQIDPRADIEASRLLDVRSVMILPLLNGGVLVGVFEIFSSRVAAFGERDERTLEALGQRVIRNLIRAQQPFPAPVEIAAVPVSILKSPQDEREPARQAEPLPATIASAATSRRGADFLTWAMGLSVLGATVFFGVLLAQRLVWPGSGVRGHSPKAAFAAAPDSRTGAQADAQNQPVQTGGTPTAVFGGSGVGRPNGPALSSQKLAPYSSTGELLVYENGKEVFRMPSSQGKAAPQSAANDAAVQRASSVELDQVLDLPQSTAEGSLLHRVEPEYPNEALQQKIQGPVVVDVRIGQDGAVQDAKLVAGDALLAQAALDAVKQWRFKPHTLNGRQVEMQSRITLNFRLPQ